MVAGSRTGPRQHRRVAPAQHDGLAVEGEPQVRLRVPSCRQTRMLNGGRRGGALPGCSVRCDHGGWRASSDASARWSARILFRPATPSRRSDVSVTGGGRSWGIAPLSHSVIASISGPCHVPSPRGRHARATKVPPALGGRWIRPERLPPIRPPPRRASSAGICASIESASSVLRARRRRTIRALVGISRELAGGAALVPHTVRRTTLRPCGTLPSKVRLKVRTAD